MAQQTKGRGGRGQGQAEGQGQQLLPPPYFHPLAPALQESFPEDLAGQSAQKTFSLRNAFLPSSQPGLPGPDNQIRASLVSSVFTQAVAPHLGKAQPHPGKLGRLHVGRGGWMPYLLLGIHHTQLHLLQVRGGEGHVVIDDSGDQRRRRLIF